MISLVMATLAGTIGGAHQQTSERPAPPVSVEEQVGAPTVHSAVI
jgi:hypothetical protein